MNDVTLTITIERLLDPDAADRFLELEAEKQGIIDSDRSAYEIEQDIDGLLSDYLDTSDFHDIVKYELDAEYSGE
jgi:hypothetical protein